MVFSRLSPKQFLRTAEIEIFNDNNDNFIDNELPSSLIGDDPILVRLQEVEFKYVGFNHVASKNQFVKKLDNAIKLLSEKVGNKYTIENGINMENI